MYAGPFKMNNIIMYYACKLVYKSCLENPKLGKKALKFLKTKNLRWKTLPPSVHILGESDI